MLKAVKGYYNGSNIVMNEHIPLQQGQEVIITVDIIDNTPNKKVDLSRFRGYGKKCLTPTLQNI